MEKKQRVLIVEDDPAQPKYIITRRGAGYYFQQEP